MQNTLVAMTPLLPMALLVAVTSEVRFSSLILGGLLLIAVIQWVFETPVAVQLMPIIAVSVVIFGLDSHRASLTATATGLLILFLSFTPSLISLMKLVPANVVVGLQTSLLILILTEAGRSFLTLFPAHGASLPSFVSAAFAALLAVGASWFILRRKAGMAFFWLVVLTVMSTPRVLFQLKPIFEVDLTIPNISDLKACVFPYLLPEFFYSGIAATVAGVRIGTVPTTSTNHAERVIPRMSGAVAGLFAYLGALIPAIPSAEGRVPGSVGPGNRRPFALIFSVALIAGVVSGLSGLIEAVADHFPEFAYPALYVTASTPFVWSLRQPLRRNDIIVAGVMAILVLWTRSFGWGFVGGWFTSGFVQMLLGESSLSSSVKELKDL